MVDPLQTWELTELLRRVEREQDEEELSAAVQLEQSAIPLLQRLRGETGSKIVLRLRGGHQCAGTVQLVTEDAVALRLHDQNWLIPMSAVVSAQMGRIPPALPPRGIERGSMRTVIRQLMDTPVRADLVDGSVVAGTLQEVGADHLVLACAQTLELVPLGALLILNWREPQLIPRHLSSDQVS